MKRQTPWSAWMLGAAALVVSAGALAGGDKPAELREAEQALEHAEKELQLAAERLAELSIKHSAGAPRAFAYRLMGGRKRAMLGVTVRLSDDGDGVHITGVTPGGPAEKAGVLAGDIIIGLDGESITGEHAGYELKELMETVEPGETVALVVRRGGKRRTLDVTTDTMRWPTMAMKAPMPPGAVPAPDGHESSECLSSLTLDLEDLGEGKRVLRVAPPAPPAPPKPPAAVPADAQRAALGSGLQLAQVNDALGRYFGVSSGVVILATAPDHPWALEAGDVIQRVDDVAVDGPVAAIEALHERRGQRARLTVIRRGAAVTVDVPVNQANLGAVQVESARWD